jgi:uncharacterized protein (UPF0332 family)
VNADAQAHLRRAEDFLKAAEDLLRTGHPAVSVGRSYYATFHAARAVLLEIGISRKSHHALWAAFGEHVAARGLIEPKYHRLGLDAFSARVESDYFAEPQDTPGDAQEALEDAREFVAACRRFLEGQ